ncbi:unnamed protein product [Cyprideis torosa]|uniref:Uncharacterized protein n=1 Tax=Cyprideis torosa TaxID=163714 RepID=A0A7R8WTT5_9CRUS|nr:unnamed protein product [Cyprideis torosa]CAG0910110.1 unnamed protein product [Cyprideis torosa]
MLRNCIAGLALVAGLTGATYAQESDGSLVGGIWVDDDGCQHWVMDLGAEGMMSPVLRQNGKPVCQSSCANLSADVLFAVDSAVVQAQGRNEINKVAAEIRNAGYSAVTVVGHTDSTGTDAYNQGLSERRATSVASILNTQGLSVTNISGAGERQPRASNATAEGRQQNRRVELFCK